MLNNACTSSRALGLACALGVVGLGASVSMGGAPGERALWQTPRAFVAAELQGEEWVRPRKYQALVLDMPQVTALLAAAPLERTGRAAQAPVVMQVPMPDGSFQRFSIVESPVIEPGLALKYPDLRAYAGTGIDDPFATIRLDTTHLGFHAQILSPFGAVYIDPVTRNDTAHYASYYKQDLVRPDSHFACGTVDAGMPVQQAVTKLAKGMRDGTPAAVSTGGTIRNYRIGICATGEYTAAQGAGTVADGVAAIMSMVNRMSGVYEVDCAVRMTLVANEDLVVFANAATDPFTAPTNTTTTNNQCQVQLDSKIGNSNYDVGHVVYKPASTSGNNGIAGGIGSVCNNTIKGKGYSAVTPATGDAIAIDYVAHELGHQFGGRHNFNSCGGSMGDSSTLAVEPGSAITIMGYAGICGAATDLDAHSIAMFNSINIEQIVAYTSTGAGNGCAQQISTGNSAPSVNPGPNYTIPYKTPFTLTASATDADGDALTYAWEERDTSSTAITPGADNGAAPICRPWLPTPDPSRTVPRLSNLLANTTVIGEILPQVSRTMKWRVTARDNKGGVDIQPTGSTYLTLSVINTGAPFLVTSPNTAVTWNAGPATVAWDVAGTTGSGINCANVKVLLSTDGGNTFSTVLAASVPNSGSASVVLPNVATSQARIKVAAVGNIFFDISNTNFTIVAAPERACCALDGTCVLTTAAACTGDFKSSEASCTPNPCTLPSAACCMADGSCVPATSVDCGILGGVYHGELAGCTPNGCPQPTGACCAADGSCNVFTATACLNSGGVYQSDNTPCVTNPCPQPMAACCGPTGACFVSTAAGCSAITGTYFPAVAACEPSPCPLPGACCNGLACASAATALVCDGHFAGAGTICNAPGNTTSPCCHADFNNSGAISVQDIFDFLSAYFSNNPRADFNQSGTNTVQDIFDFLTAYFTGCR